MLARSPFQVCFLSRRVYGLTSNAVSIQANEYLANYHHVGGRYEPEDGSLIVTALREAHEEVGLHPDAIEAS